MLDEAPVSVDNLRPANAREAAQNSLNSFLKPLSESPKPGTTGAAAIKKEQLPEHGKTPLSQQQQQNIKAGQ